MANQLEKIIKITIDTQNGVVKVNGLSAAISELDKIQRELNNTWVASTKVNKEVVEEVRRGEIAIKNEIRTLELQRGKIAETTIQYGQFTAQIQKLEKELAVLRGTAVKTATGVNQLRNNTGLASQTLVEIGRTISDSNYGFTAIANNLSQLSYYFVTLTKESKGFVNAMKSLGSQLLGAGGIVIALQFAITAYEKYSMSQREAKKATEDLNKAMASAEVEIAKLDHLNSILKDVTASAYDQEAALRALEKDGYRKLIGTTDEYIAAKKELLRYNVLEKIAADDLQKSISEEMRLKRQLLEDEEATQKRIDAAKPLTISAGGATQRIKADDVKKQIQDEFKIREDATKKEIEKVIANRERDAATLNTLFDESVNALKANNFRCLLFGDCKEPKESKELDFIKQNFLDFSKDILRIQRDAEQGFIDTEEDKLARQRQYAAEAIEIEYQIFIEKERVRNLTKLAETKDQTEKEQILANLAATEKQAVQARDNALSEIKISFDKREETLEQEKARRIKAILESSVIDRLNANARLSRNALDAIEFESQAEAKAHQQKMSQLQELYDYRVSKGYDVAEVEAQMATETARHNEAEAGLFRKTQETKLDIAKKVGDSIMQIAGEGSAVGKAVGVAMAIINTREAITSALGQKPYGPWNIASAVAAGAFGFAQVKEIMQQKLPVEGKGGSGAKSAPSIQAPAFNIVGSSGTSQIASAVQGQFDKPIKAYVLAKDVSTAQEMDRNIVGAASLG